MAKGGINMAVWMMITKDEYELPLIIADTAKELAVLAGTSEDVVRSTISKFECGKRKFSKFRRVKI